MFKVGDKVRVVCNYKFSNNKISNGSIGKIGKIIDNAICKIRVDFDEAFEWFKESELELVEEPMETLKNKGEEIMGLQGTIPKIVSENSVKDTSQFISMDYRTEYYKKVEECEKLKVKLEWLWDSILKGER